MTRPSEITALLTTIKSGYSDIGDTLEAYIANLEANQATASNKKQSNEWDPEHPPYWSHQRSVQRAQRRQQRALNRVLHNYR